MYYVYNETSSVNDQVIFEPRRQKTCLGGFRQVFSCRGSLRKVKDDQDFNI